MALSLRLTLTWTDLDLWFTRLLMALIIVGFVYMTPSFKDPSTNIYPFYFYLLCIVINALNSTASAFMSLSTVAFFTRISDKRIGGKHFFKVFYSASEEKSQRARFFRHLHDNAQYNLKHR